MPVNLINEKELNAYLTNLVWHGENVPSFPTTALNDVAFVSEHKDDVIRLIIAQYIKHRIRSYLTQSEQTDFLTPVDLNQPNLPAWVNGVREQKGSVYQFDAEKIPAYLTEQLTSIRDFLYATAQKYVEAKLQIAQQADNHRRSAFRIQANYLKTNNNYATFEQVLNATEKWHKELAQTSKKRPIEILNESLKGVEVVFEIDDNLTLYRLKTPEALDFESEQMGHCIGKGSYDIYVQNGMIEIYSIRDKNGNPHVTFEVRNGKMHQCKGKQNKMPKFKYIPAVQKVIQQQEWKIVEDIQNTFFITTQEGVLHNMFCLPKNEEFIFVGDLDLSNSNLTKLPDLSNVMICGSFNCSGNRLSSLEGSPQRILGDFNCSHNMINTLRNGPKYGVTNYNCSYNKLKTLECGNIFMNYFNFNCSHNMLTTLKGAPLKVDGCFDCSYNKLVFINEKELSENIEIIDCSYNPLQYVSARFFDIRKKCEFVCQGNNFEIVSPQNFPTKSDNGRG
ncbi:MAG: hypothetical protein E7014_07195 [Alphaproteobacteria bacterium]|nr:hypothetical protein [Alphaproteobacteria bacterium]